jgi:hypothetical protein
VSAAAAAPDVYRMLADPLHAFSGPSFSMVANSAVAAIHLYHCLAFPLPAADIFHHVTFVSVLCGLAIPFKQMGGCANNFGCFFLSGLPGGIDYVLLVLVREGRLAKMAEKRWNARINTWLRAPPMTVYAFVGYLGWLYGTTAGLPLWALVVVVFLVRAPAGGRRPRWLSPTTPPRHRTSSTASTTWRWPSATTTPRARPRRRRARPPTTRTTSTASTHLFFSLS